MGETANTSKLANRVSDDIFKWLKWSSKPLTDVDWECVNVEKHQTHKFKKHPTDIVFYYTHPYSGKTIYINTDLKSYKSTSITETSVRNSLKSLARSIECALISPDWQEKFTDPNDDFEVSGLLFTFNYDNHYSKDFLKILQGIRLETLGIQEGQVIAVFGPETINYLINLVNDLRLVVQDNEQLGPNSYNFFYPQLVMNKKHSLDNYAATTEAILSPYLIVEFKETCKKQYVIYYKESGDTVDEFIYLIDILSNYQILDTKNSIEVVLYNTECSNILIHFESAKRQYAKAWGLSLEDSNFKNLTARLISRIQHTYNPLNEGMQDE